MAVKILKDGEDISTMPIEYAPNFTKEYNADICAELGIEFRMTMLQSVLTQNNYWFITYAVMHNKNFIFV